MTKLTIHFLFVAIVASIFGAACAAPNPRKPTVLEICPGHEAAAEKDTRYQAFLAGMESLAELKWKIVETDFKEFKAKAERCNEYIASECFVVEIEASDEGTLAFYIPKTEDQIHTPSHWIKEVEWKFSDVSCNLIAILEIKLRGRGIEIKKQEASSEDEYKFGEEKEAEGAEDSAEGSDDTEGAEQPEVFLD